MTRSSKKLVQLKPRQVTLKDEAGFSLLETLIAMVLMAVVGLGIASLFAYAASNTVTAADRELAMAVAQQRMEQLRNVAFADATLTATSTAGNTTNISRAGRQYAVVTIIADANVVNGLATAKTITVIATPQNGTSTWASAVSTLFGSVRLISQRTSQLLGPNRDL